MAIAAGAPLVSRRKRSVMIRWAFAPVSGHNDRANVSQARNDSRCGFVTERIRLEDTSMLRKRTMAVCVMVMAAIGMVAAATADALPEWQKEKKALTAPLPFKLKGGSGSFENTGATTITVTWTSVVGSGQIEGTNVISKLSLGFWGSKAKEGAGPACEVNSPKAKNGEVVTKQLKGLLGYLNKGEPKVGDVFEPVTGKTFAEVEGKCLKAKVLVTGSVIGKITSALNTEVGAVGLSFSAGGKAQEFVKFEGEAEEHKLAFGEPGEAALFECKEESLELEKGAKVELRA